MMHPGQRQAELQVMRWAERHPDARTVPPHIDSCLDRIRRYEQMTTAEARVKVDPYQLASIEIDLLDQLPAYSARREAEQELAVYVDRVASETLSPDLYQVAQSLHDCRQTGAVGIKPDGGMMIAWDQKCGHVRLCPDESREETQRLAEWYLPPLVEFKKADPRNRIFYAVFTDHNFRPGQLRAGKKYLFEKFKNWMQPARPMCRVMFENGPACAVPRRPKGEQPITLKADATPWDLRGALVIQEDPLSAAGDWNVHLNAFLLVHGRFDYAAARAEWGANVHFQEIDGTPESVRGALLEAIKYSARIVPEKSQDKAEAGESAAPAMTEWPADRWLEWWRAGQRFRRVRSYGCLYGLHEKRWNAMTEREQVNTCALAEIPPVGVAGAAWRELGEDTRAKLRRVMTHGEPLDMSLVEWVGAVKFGEDGVYWVDLIPGDNFSGSGAGRTSSAGSARPFDPGGGRHGP